MKNNVLIKLKDNQNYEKAYSFVEDGIICGDKEIPKQYWEGIKHVNDINELLAYHKTVVIPQGNSYKNSEIFKRINDKLFTFNWVGVLSYRTDNQEKYRIEINSRFDTGSKQYFLLYLLCSVCGINVFDIDVNSGNESDYRLILALLFLYRLVDAYGDGLYKEYVRKEYNDFSFKGAIDINRHIRFNNPFAGKTAYSIREYSYDNEILCLIRQAIDYIVEYFQGIWGSYSCNNPILNEIADVIETATPSYRMNVNYSELLKCRKEITHPMYKKYDDVRKIALMILQEAGQNVFDDAEYDSFGILIDISWLWEEFIAVKLLDDRYLHLLTDRSNGSLQWADKEYWYPDFIEKGNEKCRRNVFDAKYKFWKWNKDEDVHQLLSYLFLTGGERCGIIYPFPNDTLSSVSYKELNAFDLFYNRKARIYELPLYVPQSENFGYKEYCERIEESIENWKIRFADIV